MQSLDLFERDGKFFLKLEDNFSDGKVTVTLEITEEIGLQIAISIYNFFNPNDKL